MEYWTIRPLVGRGALRFGIGPNESTQFAGAYGAAEGQSSLEGLSAVEEETRRLFGQFFSHESLDAGKAEARRQEADGGIRQSLGDHGIDLEFINEGLREITLSARTSQAHFDGQRVFSLPAADVLALFETANAGPGRYASTGAAFDRIGVYLDSFTVTKADESAPLDATDDRFQERTITLKAVPDDLRQMLPEGRALSFR